MKKILFITIILFAFIGLKAQSLEEANDLYKSEDYKKASEIYESILSQDLESSSLYFNLGNCYYKQKKVAPAILNYERALLLNPSDGDIKYNLRMARTLVTDKIEAIPVFFLNMWLEELVMFLNSDSWAIISLVSFCVILVLMIFFFFTTSIRKKKVFFSFSIFLSLVVVFSIICASTQKNRLTKREYAVVFSPSVTVKGSPNESGTELFLLHEGTKVKVIEVLGIWTNVQLSDGNEGWLISESISRI